jgi:hypothetical protein
VQIGSQAPVYFDHANSRLEVGRSRVFVSPNLRAPIAAGTYNVAFTFYKGDLNGGGVCGGAQIGNVYTKTNAVQVNAFGVIWNTSGNNNTYVALRSRRNVVGDIAVIGNTSLCIPAADLGHSYDVSSANAYRSGMKWYAYMNCRSPQASFHATQEDDNMLYAYVLDSGALTGSINLSNTMATLNLPAGAKVVEATLYTIGRIPNIARGTEAMSDNPSAYWQEPAYTNGHQWPSNSTTCKYRNDGSLYTSCKLGSSAESYGYTVNPYWTAMAYAETVRLKAPGKGYEKVYMHAAYIDADPDETEHYLMRSDVTHLIDADNPNGDYYVKGVQSKLHGYKYGTYAGWALAVTYEDANDLLKQVVKYDGMEHTTSGLSLFLSGFRTPITHDVNGTFIYMVGDGDYTETGDYLVLNANSNGSRYSGAGASADPVYKGQALQIGGNNAFHATVTRDGANVTARKPNDVYSLGFDLHTLKLSNVLGRNQTATTIYTKAGGDYHGAGFFAFSTMIYSPKIAEIFQDANVTSCANSRNLKGASVDYTLSFANTGTTTATNVQLVDDFDENGIYDLFDHSKTTTPILRRYNASGVLDPAVGGTCSVTLFGVSCDIASIPVNYRYEVEFNVTIKDDNISASDFNREGGFVNVATARYYNPEAAEWVDQPAEVRDPRFISDESCNVHSCVDPRLSIPVKTFNLAGDGLYVIRPFQSVYGDYAGGDVNDPFEEPMLVYCNGIQAYLNSGSANEERNASLIEVWLPLPMSMPNDTDSTPHPIASNFSFTSFSGGNANKRYYHPNHTRAPFPKILNGKTLQSNEYGWSGTGDPNYPIYGLRLNMDDLTLHESMYDNGGKFNFANINLIGTSLAIDEARSTLNCNGAIKGYYGQVVKSDLLNNPAQQCYVNSASGKLAFKQLSGGGDYDYRYAELRSPRGGQKADRSTELYFSCRDIQQYGPSGGHYENGFYLIDPLDNRGVPFVAHCSMPASQSIGANENELITTSLLALDGRMIYQAADMTQETCTSLGLTFFVPMEKKLFDNMQTRLAAQRSQWQNYTGTLNTWYLGISGGADASVGYYIPGLQGRTVWPYGPFGLYRGSLGSSAEAGKTLHSHGLHSSNSAEQPDQTLAYYGWRTVFDVNGTVNGANDVVRAMMQRTATKAGFGEAKLEPTFWISDDGCTYAPNSEPSGNYAASTWLNYVYDNAGAVVYCDDSNDRQMGAIAEYVYTNYACIGLDSYFTASANSLPSKGAGWDETLSVAGDPAALFTKMAEGQDIKIQIAPLNDDPIKSYTGQMCAKLVVKNETGIGDPLWSAPPNSATSAAGVTDGGSYDGYYCANVDAAANISLVDNPIVFTWDKDKSRLASREAFVQILMIDCVYSNDVSECASVESNSSSFSLRPRFNPGVSAAQHALIAGRYYGTTANSSATPYPIYQLPPAISATATAGYKRESGAQVCYANANLCVNAKDRILGDVSGKIDANVTFSGLSPNELHVNWLEYRDVGDINLSLLDKAWTKIDQDVTYDPPLDPSLARWKNDCIPDSNVTIAITDPLNPNNDGKIGCDVEWGMPRTVYNPADLNISRLSVIGRFEGADAGLDVNRSFVYYADNDADALKNRMFAVVKIDAQAVNDKGEITESYGDGNYSRDIAYVADIAVGNPIDMPSEVIDNISNRWLGYYDGASVNTEAMPRNAWNAGTAKDVELALNFNRDDTTSLPVLFMQAGDGCDTTPANCVFTLTLTEVSGADDLPDAVLASGSSKWDKNKSDYLSIDFIYGRANMLDVVSRTGDANLSFAIDYFSNNVGSGAGSIRDINKLPSDTAASTGWFKVLYANDNNSTGDIRANVEVDDIDVKGLYLDNRYDYTYSGDVPRRFVSHLHIPTYLWYHPFAAASGYREVRPGEVENRKGCFEHPCGTIEFLPQSVDGWGGSGARDDGRFYEDNTTREQSPVRLGR